MFAGLAAGAASTIKNMQNFPENNPQNADNSAQPNNNQFAIPNTQPPPQPSPNNQNEENKQTSKEKKIKSSGSKLSPKTLLLGFFVIGGLLIAVFYILLLWGLLGGNISNPLFETLGIESGELKETLLFMTNSIFGIAALILLVIILMQIFRLITTRDNHELKRSYLIKFGVFSGVFFGICASWIGMFWLINNANAGSKIKKNDFMITTKPEIVIGLTSPITIEFDIGKKLFTQIDPSLIRQINWDFNSDKDIDASGPIVTHRFLNKGEKNGRFLVTAEVAYFSPNDNEEKKYLTSREVIIANEAVMGIITASPEAGAVPLKTELSAIESKDPDGNIVLYEWDLDNDGEFEIFGEDKYIVSKTFSQIGDFIVKLRVTGSNNDFDVVEQKITVAGPEEVLRAEISSNEGFEGFVPFKVNLDGSQSFVKFGKIIKYEWNIKGEQKTTINRKIQRIFYEPGDYEVSLTVENEIGERHKKTEIIKVKEKPTEVLLKIRTTPKPEKDNIVYGQVPFKIVFDSTQSQIDKAIEWQWDFENDGVVDNFEAVVKHIFRNPGTYNTKLTVIDSDKKSYEKIQKVVVSRVGTVAMINSEPSSGSVPLTVTFDGSASTTDDGKIIDYIWEFPGENPVHYNAQISYEFKKIGIFPVKLTVLSSKGKKAETEILISVRAKPVQANFSFSPMAGKAPLEVKFDSVESTGNIKTYLWNFGDGITSNKFQPTHIFRKPGNYEVLLRITDQKGIVSEVTKNILVE